MEKISAIRGFVAMLIAFLWLLPSVANADPHKLTCGKEKTIGEALHELKPGDTPLVSGTCNENVVIPEEVHRITLDGQGTATINGPDPSASTVSVRGAGITIKGFTITGGRNGITAAGARRLTIQNCEVEATGNNGINFGQDSNGTVDSCTVQGNPAQGINISGTATVTNSTISGNGRRGIQVSNGGSANLTGNNISNNQGAGVNITTATAFLTGNTISNNNGTDGNGGVTLNMATANFVGGNTITNNAVGGITAQASGVIIGDPGANPNNNTISGNGATGTAGGIFAFLGSMVTIRNATISGNIGSGLTVRSRSVANFFAPSTVNNNTGDGIRLTLGGALTGLSQVTASGNVGFGLQCTDNESSFEGGTAGITGNTAGNVSPSCTGF